MRLTASFLVVFMIRYVTDWNRKTETTSVYFIIAKTYIMLTVYLSAFAKLAKCSACLDKTVVIVLSLASIISQKYWENNLSKNNIYIKDVEFSLIPSGLLVVFNNSLVSSSSDRNWSCQSKRHLSTTLEKKLFNLHQILSIFF